MHWHSRISRFPNGQPGKKIAVAPQNTNVFWGPLNSRRQNFFNAKGKNASKIFRILIPTFIFIFFCVK